jgi:sialate O-acetylesterase
MRIFTSFLWVSLLCTSPLLADITLPALISNGMVLEKSAKTPVWGKASPGEEVSVLFNGQSTTTTADNQGKWKIHLDLEKSPAGPFEMVIKGKNTLTLTDVLVGEVWVGSGQSNMAWTMANTTTSAEEKARPANPQIRQFTVKQNASAEAQDDVVGTWISASPETTDKFSAVGYHFAKALHQDLQVPVGLVISAWGGTPIESWTSMPAIDSVPAFKARRAQLWPDLVRFPAYQKEKEDYITAMKAWTQKAGREDKPAPETSPYAGDTITASEWTPVEIPGAVTAPQLPGAGIVWIRREIDLPDPGASPMALNLPLDGFDTIYWNGKLIAQTTLENFPGLGVVRRSGRYSVAPALLRKGKNTLAIRFYQPVQAAKFNGIPKVGALSLNGTWLARPESSFPPLAQGLDPAPQPPTAPFGAQNIASSLFNGMIHPLLPLAFSGVIWYQGESNAGRAHQYRSTFPLMINDWRTQWGRPDLPFYFCQLANFKAKTPVPGESDWAELREAQSSTLSLPHTGQAVLIDIGESADIHPRNKKDAGERLARIALAKDYAKTVVYSGPVYESKRIDGSKIVLSFKHADGGLAAKPLPETYDVNTAQKLTAPLVRHSPNSPLEGFAICGEDKKWVWAEARIEGNQVIVQSDQVSAPMAVRYAWADNPTCNLFNGAGLPASPFRTDDFPATTLTGTY